MCAITEAYVCSHERLRIFSRDTPDRFQHIDAHFTSRPQKVTRGKEFDCNQPLNELLCSVDNFDARGSGFVLDKCEAAW